MKRSLVVLSFLLVVSAMPCAAQPVLDTLAVVGDSTLAWCGVTLGSEAEALDAAGIKVDLTVDPGAPGTESGSTTLCAHEVVLHFNQGRLELIGVYLPADGEEMAASASATIEARIGPVEPVVSPVSDRTFYVPAQAPQTAVVFDTEELWMGVGLTLAYPDYIPAHLLE